MLSISELHIIQYHTALPNTSLNSQYIRLNRNLILFRGVIVLSIMLISLGLSKALSYSYYTLGRGGVNPYGGTKALSLRYIG
jgi:hypothetical protein